jgi:hypothetical protein
MSSVTIDGSRRRGPAGHPTSKVFLAGDRAVLEPVLAQLDASVEVVDPGSADVVLCHPDRVSCVADVVRAVNPKPVVALLAGSASAGDVVSAFNAGADACVRLTATDAVAAHLHAVIRRTLAAPAEEDPGGTSPPPG